jgi:hypothetical protein
MMGKLKRKVNEEKTHLGRSPQEKFDFLGYTFGRCYSPKTGRATIGPRPSKKSIQRRVASLSEQTDRRNTWLTADEIAGRLNRKLKGWANDFCLGSVSASYRAINAYAEKRLRQW